MRGDEEPGGRHRRDHGGHRQRERSARAERNDRDAIGPPVRQIVDRFAGCREHQEAKQRVEGGDGGDDRDDPETGDQGGVDAANGYSESSREQQAEDPIASADCVQGERCEVLRDRGRDGEGDIDAASDQDNQQSDGPNDVDRVVVHQRRKISGAEEGRRGEAEKQRQRREDNEKTRLTLVRSQIVTHRRRAPDSAIEM